MLLNDTDVFLIKLKVQTGLPQFKGEGTEKQPSVHREGDRVCPQASSLLVISEYNNSTGSVCAKQSPEQLHCSLHKQCRSSAASELR